MTETRINDGGPAFPTDSAHQSGPYTPHYEGMTLRDHFATFAMHAELNTAGAHEAPAIALSEAAIDAGRTNDQQIAFNAYKLADAMIAERNKGGAE